MRNAKSWAGPIAANVTSLSHQKILFESDRHREKHNVCLAILRARGVNALLPITTVSCVALSCSICRPASDLQWILSGGLTRVHNVGASQKRMPLLHSQSLLWEKFTNSSESRMRISFVLIVLILESPNANQVFAYCTSCCQIVSELLSQVCSFRIVSYTYCHNGVSNLRRNI